MATSLSSLLGGLYTGPSGFSGYSGVGTSGFSGYSGISGYSGRSGYSGFSGSGSSGFSGFSGAVSQPALLSRYHNTLQTLTTGADTRVIFNTALQTVGSIGLTYDSVTNIGRFTNTSGSQKTYTINATVAFNLNATGVRLLYILVNGTTRYAEVLYPAVSANDAAVLNAGATVSLANNEYFEVWAFQTTGISLNIGQFGGTPGSLVTITQSGGQGDTGATGLSGFSGQPGGFSGFSGYSGVQGQGAGLRYNFSTTTTAADPGTGNFRFNNALIASTTQIYISTLNVGSVDFAAFIDSWDDSSSVNKGMLMIDSNTNSDTSIAYFSVTSVTGTGTWRTVAVTYVSGTIFADTEATVINFSRTGDSGFSGVAFNGGTVTNPIFINNATAATSAGDGALQVLGGAGIAGDIYLSGELFETYSPGVYVNATPIKKYKLTGDVSISSSVVANLSGFSFPLSVVGATYLFQFFITYAGGTTGASLGAALTFPGATFFAATQTTITGAAGGTYTLPLLTTGAKVQSLSVAVANNSYLGVIQGTITVSTSGTLQLQVATGITGTTTSNLTIRRGTAGWLWRMS